MNHANLNKFPCFTTKTNILYKNQENGPEKESLRNIPDCFLEGLNIGGGNEKIDDQNYKNLEILQQKLNTLNTSKYFTGVMMILLNVGSRFVEIRLGDSMEAFVKYNVARELLIFTMAWMGTRDILVALVLTAVFTVLSNFLLNSKSKLCVLPDKYKYIKVDTNNDGTISDVEINQAIETLEKAKRQKDKERNINAPQLSPLLL